jgi:MFS family permease
MVESKMDIGGAPRLARQAASRAPSPKVRSLLAACLAHALHDGYTDALYAFLPVWQMQFHLSYAGLGAVRALYYGTMGGLQLPGEKLTRSVSARSALALSCLIASAGFMIIASPTGMAGLILGLVVAGVGSSLQHPRGSQLVTETYGRSSRGPLGVYNFSGDLGKATLPAVAALLLPILAWRPVIGMMALLGLAVTVGLGCLAPAQIAAPREKTETSASPQTGQGFGRLTAIGALDTATRMGFLLFLPFLIHARGGASATVGLGLALLFIGGALGKATCSWLGRRLGVVGSVIVTEVATAVLIAATLATPLTSMLVLLPVLGVVLNGTSSVLYGTVPELAPRGDTGRAFAIFYTAVIGSGGVAPILYGALADHTSQTVGIVAAATTAVLIVPVVLSLRPALGGSASAPRA